ncbi:MAG: Glutamate--tRNA ligase [Bacteroidota bacterium]|nr:MAG: Glutamate--tRNA ligase [Bacteroidota bacterium]
MAVRVRFAPSPTGPLHIGGVRTALYNYLFAKKHKGTFVLRIEDTDQNRYVEEAEPYIHNALAWLGIVPDESSRANGAFGPYRQSERKKLYVKHINELVSVGNAYVAFDTPEELARMRSEAESKGETFIYNWKNRNALKNSTTLSEKETQELIGKGAPHVVRFKMYSEKDEKNLRLHDQVRGTIDVDLSLLDDKILVKQDGMPTYHLANIVDDHYMEISHVIRGEEWLPSMALHVLLYLAFGWNPPVFAHVPLILKPTGKGKLSKRDGDKFGFPVFPLEWDENTPGFKEYGYLPESLINYLALLGWSPGGEQELFSMDELISSFSLEAITKSGGRFDPERCKWFNQQYLQHIDSSIVAAELEKELKKNSVSSGALDLTRIAKLIQNRLTLLTDVWKEADFFFVAPEDYDEKAVSKQWKDDTAKILSSVAELIDSADVKTADTLGVLIKSYANDNGIGLGKIMAPLRIALVGSLRGPDVFEICSTIGAQNSISRINTAIKHISA